MTGHIDAIVVSMKDNSSEQLPVPSSDLPPVRHRRYWSTEEKEAILRDAEVQGVAQTSREQGVPTNLIYTWRKQLGRVQEHAAPQDRLLDPLSEYRADMATIRHGEELLASITLRLKQEIAEGRGNAYNLSCSVNNVVSARGKLLALKWQLMETLQPLEEADSNKHEPEYMMGDDDEMRRAIELEAEKMVYLVCRESVLDKRAATLKQSSVSYSEV